MAKAKGQEENNKIEISHDSIQGSYQKQGMRVSWVSIIINVILSIFKLIAGIVAHSGAMISDAIHSASDVFSTFLVMIGINISNKKEDKEHPYGHERLECVIAMLLAVVLAVTGLGIGKVGLDKIVLGMQGDLAAPGILALVAALVSIAVKEWMYWYTRGVAKRINSASLLADAWHHRSDALSSVGSFVGILGARLGFPILDPIASLVICLMILKVAFDICRDALGKMVDRSCDEDTVAAIRNLTMRNCGVIQIDLLKTRKFASKVYVDMEISVNKDLSLIEAHEIAECVHDLIEKEMPLVKHCMIHVNPYLSESSDDEPKES